ncbi:TetR/AcrR family transcriptional regulator C-terminal domain-containing protein [Streptomyces sp. KL2]|uniref:TetR/AcrR family transcriptional regulator C-terminal domain-containing protein n=1 Tax=Streptomyces sp. KL2 TaxID=3050126 RepID=UPI00397A6D31
MAARADSSKESLYTWSGNRQGLLAALIERQAGSVDAAVVQAVDRPHDCARTTLAAIARNLLSLLVGDASTALNRAAMNSQELAALPLRHGRHTTGPLVASFLQRLADEGRLRIDGPENAFQLSYGPVVRDLQIRVLLVGREAGSPGLSPRCGRWLTCGGGAHPEFFPCGPGGWRAVQGAGDG